MRVNRQEQATQGLLVLAVLLGSLWTGGLVASAAGNPADHLTARRSLLGIEPATPPAGGPTLRPAVDRPSRSGRLVKVPLGMVAAALAVAYGRYGRRPRSSWARARSLVQSARLHARAPPSLQSA
jgi:hypothetical protein